MPPEANTDQATDQQTNAQVGAGTTGQQTPPVTGSDPAGTPGTQPQPGQAVGSGEETWEQRYNATFARYQGLSRQYTSLTQERDDVAQARDEATELAGTLQGQLEATQGIAQSATTTLQETREQLGRAQQEAAYLSLVQTEYPDLASIAGALQRMPTADRQRALFDQVRQTMGSQVATAAAQAVTQNLQGVTPGAGPSAGGAAAQAGMPDYEAVMSHVMDNDLLRRNPEEYARWWNIYQQHPDMGASSLGRTWEDPFGNDFQARQRAVGQQPANLNQRHPTQTFEPRGPVELQPSSAYPGAWGGTTPPQPGQDPFQG